MDANVDLSATPQALFDVAERRLERLDQLVTPSCRSLSAWWLGQSAQGVPAKAAFDFLDHVAIAPHLFLIEHRLPVQLVEIA